MRFLEITGIPGHHPTSIAVYDEQTGLLLTGDTLYPGHLFISDYDTYRTSIQRMADWMSNHNPTWIVGTHVEMSANHTGLLMANDFEVALNTLRSGAFTMSKLEMKDAAKDLVSYTVSDRYMALRKHLGIALETGGTAQQDVPKPPVS